MMIKGPIQRKAKILEVFFQIECTKNTKIYLASLKNTIFFPEFCPDKPGMKDN